jgi:hypothetical protein
MRVLLKEGAEQATATSILAVDPELRETTLTTLSGEGVKGGIVAEVDNQALVEIIDAVVEECAARGATAKRLIKEVAWMARVVSPYEVGSRVVRHITHDGCVIDKRQAKRAMPYSSLTPEERRSAEEADERGDHGSLASRLGRLGDARDATAQRLEEMRRPEVRPVDRRLLYTQLDSYDRELVELRGELLANSRSSSG